MNNLTAFRKFRRSQTPRVFAALLLAWLTFVVQPCVMAVSLSDEAAARVQMQIASDSHHDSASQESCEPCPHCGTSGPCDLAGVPSCDSPDAAKQNNVLKSVETGAEFLATMKSTWNEEIPRYDRVALTIVDAADLLPRPVSLSIAYCVFLK